MATRRTFLKSTATVFGAGAISSTSFLCAFAAGDPLAPYRTPYKYGKLILEHSSDPAAFDGKSVDCPFVFQYGKLFYMAYVGYDGIGYQTGLSSSEDLVHWKREGCILRRDPNSPYTKFNVAMNWIVRENDLNSPGKLKKVNGRYLGAYHAYPNAGYESGPAVIGLCWSEDLLHWELEPPFLHPDNKDATAWENGGLYKPCLVEEGGKYYLFYNAKTKPIPGRKGWYEQIGVATSADLKTWTRFPENPIIKNGPEGSWDDRFASDPCVVRHRNQWAIFYYGLSSKGKARDLLAVGKDPFHPQKMDSILVDAGPPGSVDDDFAHKPSVITYKGDLYHFYCAVSGKYPDDIRGISVARSRPWN